MADLDIDSPLADAQPSRPARPRPADSDVLEPTSVRPAKPSGASSQLAWLLDDLITIPGTNIGIGLDGLIGLIPGIGDASTTALASVIFADAIRHRVPLTVLARMGLNLGIDALIGLVPFVGDAFDFAHRANRKNMRLLERAIADRDETHQASKTYLIVAISMVLAIIVGLIVLIFLGLWTLLRVLGLLR